MTSASSLRGASLLADYIFLLEFAQQGSSQAEWWEKGSSSMRPTLHSRPAYRASSSKLQVPVTVLNATQSHQNLVSDPWLGRNREGDGR